MFSNYQTINLHEYSYNYSSYIDLVCRVTALDVSDLLVLQCHICCRFPCLLAYKRKPSVCVRKFQTLFLNKPQLYCYTHSHCRPTASPFFAHDKLTCYTNGQVKLVNSSLSLWQVFQQYSFICLPS